MRTKKVLKRVIGGLGLLLALDVSPKVIDFPISDWSQPSLQLAYDKAESGDTIQFRRVSGNRIYSGTLVADEDKTVIIDADMFGWRLDTPIKVSAGDLKIINHPLFHSVERTIDVTGKGSLFLDSAHFTWGTAVNISTSGTVELRECWATIGATINLEKLVGEGSLIISRSDFQNQRGGSIIFGEEQPDSNYTIQINNNSFYDVETPFKFTSQLKNTTGLISNNSTVKYDTYAINPDKSGKVEITSNNYYNFLPQESSAGELEQSILSESLGDIGNNFSFNPRFEDGEFGEDLAYDSPLIDRGVFIKGLQYNGNAPDISRVESPYTRGTTPEPTTIILLGLAGLLTGRKR